MPTGPISREHPGDQLGKLLRAGADLSGESREPSGVAVATTLAFIAFLLTSAVGARDTAPIVFVGVFVGVLGLLAMVMLVAARKERAQREQRQRMLLLGHAADRLGRAGITKFEQFGLLTRLIAETRHAGGYELDRLQLDEILSAIQAAETPTEPGSLDELASLIMSGVLAGDDVRVVLVGDDAMGIVRTNRVRRWLVTRLDLSQGAGDPGIGVGRAGHLSRLELKLLAKLARDRKRADETAIAEMLEMMVAVRLLLEEKRRR